MGNKVSINDAQFISRAGRDIVTETIGREVGAVGTAIGEAIEGNESPLNRQMANKLTVQDAAFISRAGRDIVTETIGQEIGAVGTAIGEALEGAKERSAAKKASDKAALEAANKKRLEESSNTGNGQQIVDTSGIGDRSTGKYNQENQGPTEGAMPARENKGGGEAVSVLDSLNLGYFGFTKFPSDKPNTTNTKADALVDTPAQVEKEKQTGGGGLPTFEEAWNGNLGGIQEKYKGNKQKYLKDKATQGKETEARRAWAFKTLGPNETYNEEIHGEQYKASIGSMATRLKDNSPFSRQRTDDLASMYAVNIGGSDISGSTDESQYQEGRTYVEKERKLSSASFMGSAAIEGYNLAVEGRNYDKQVQADAEDYFNEMTAGLVPERTGIDYLDQSLNELGNQSMKEYAAHQKDRTAAIREGRKSEWDIKNKELMNLPDSVLNAKDAITSIVGEFEEGAVAGTIDIPGSNPVFVDLLNTLLQGGSILGVVDLKDGVGASVAGATIRDEPIQMSLTGVAQKLGEMSLVKKQDPMEFYNEFTANIKADKIPGVEKQHTVDANGNKITKYNTAQLGRVLDVYIKEELRETNSARGYGSALLGLDHRQYGEMVKDSESDPKGLIAAKMKKDMMDILAPMENYRSKESTTSSNQLEREQITIREEQRNEQREQNLGNGNDQPTPTEDYMGWARSVFAGADASDSDKPTAQEKYNVSKANQIKGVSSSMIVDNQLQLFDKKGEVVKVIDFSDTEEGIKTLGGYAKDKGLSIGTDQASNFDAKDFINKFNKNKKSNQI